MSIYEDFQRDAADAAKYVNEDGLVTSRYGPQPKKTWLYLQREFERAIPFTKAGEFATGFTYESTNQTGLDSNGEYWIYNGDVPFTVAAGTVPSEPDYTKVIYNDVNNLIGVDQPNQFDGFYRRTVDLSVASSENPPISSKYHVDDKPNNPFIIEALDSPDGVQSFDIGNGKQATSDFVRRTSALTDGAILTGVYDFEFHQYNLTGVDEPTFKLGLGDGQTSGVMAFNFDATGDSPQPSNNSAVVTGSSIKDSIISNFTVTAGYNSIGLEFGEIVVGERRSGSTHYDNAIAKGDYLGFEMFSPYTSMLRGIADRNGLTRGLQHGLRITGYGEDHLGQGNDLRNVGNRYDVVVNNYANGVSLQTGAYANTVTASIKSCTNGISSTDNSTLPDAISSSNNFTFTAHECDRGLFMLDPSSNIFSGAIVSTTVSGVETDIASRKAESNIYNLTVKDAVTNRFEDSYSLINLTVNECNNATVITGDGNIINATFENINNNTGTSPALVLSGDKNIANIVGSDLNQTNNQVTVSGSSNQITLSLIDDSLPVIISGTGNKVSGFCTIDPSSSSDNDFSGVYGWRQSGSESVTTDGSGRATISVSTPVGSYYVDCNNRDFSNHYNILITGRNSTSFTIIAYDQAGSPAASVSLNLLYHIECYL